MLLVLGKLQPLFTNVPPTEVPICLKHSDAYLLYHKLDSLNREVLVVCKALQYLGYFYMTSLQNYYEVLCLSVFFI